MPFRFVTIGLLVAVLLGGLYSLMVPLKAPMLHVFPKDVLVSGCDEDRTDDAASLCPQLYCYRAVLLSNLIPRNSKLQIVRSEEKAETGWRAWAGVARPNKQPQEAGTFFRCTTQGDTVESFDVLTPEKWEQIENAESWWEI